MQRAVEPFATTPRRVYQSKNEYGKRLLFARVMGQRRTDLGPGPAIGTQKSAAVAGSKTMNQHVPPTDLEIAALISSKIVHDVIGPVGAIYNGLEILDEDDDDVEAKTYAMEVIRNVTQQASARLQYARFAFGAAGSAGAMIDLGTAEQISRGYLNGSKHKLNWQGEPGHMIKDKVKLLLNLVASAISSLPRGGEIDLKITGPLECPAFTFKCRGTGARPPQYLTDFVTGNSAPQLDAMTIQAYYTWRLAASAGMRLDIAKDGADIVITASPI